MTIKAIVLDIDGTLLNNDKIITSKTKKALIDAQKKGIKVILASGRPTSGMWKHAEELLLDQYDGLLVSYNGAHVLDTTTGQESFSQTLTVEIGQQILEHLKKFDVKPMITKDDYLYVNDVYNCMLDLPAPLGHFNIINYEARGGNFLLCEQKDLAAFANFPLHKILVAGQPEYLTEHWEEIRTPFKDTVSMVFSAPMYIEFTDLGIDKAHALDTVLKPLQIYPEHIIAFGDGQNDLSMIEYAGTGVAMGNAVEELKKAANKITATNNEDGIAKILEELL